MYGNTAIFDPFKVRVAGILPTPYACIELDNAEGAEYVGSPENPANPVVVDEQYIAMKYIWPPVRCTPAYGDFITPAPSYQKDEPTKLLERELS